MPHPTDKSEPSTLPDPELNPLLNPLLAANMGRWAEVYFTSPPERRSAAVAELLRELEAGSSAKPASQVPDDLRDEGELDRTYEAPLPKPILNAAQHSENTAEPSAICSKCGYNSPEAQRFCGMCGATLPNTPEGPSAEISESQPIVSWLEPEAVSNPEAYYQVEPRVQGDGFNNASEQHSDLLERWQPLPQADLPQFAMEPPPVPYRYRLYVGVVLAILLTVLLYMAWRGTAALSGVQQSPPSRIMPAAQPAPAANEPPAPKNSAQSPARDVVPVDAAPTPKRADNSVQRDRNAENPQVHPVQSAKSSTPNTHTEPAAAPRMVPADAKSPALAMEQSSAQDFATAEKYLKGARGSSRDSREASQWLWKAVSKGNPAATVALSDLYLRGDGVPKNCDQARLLLDAAARKGVKGAADRLRNLQAFGCR